MLLIQIQKAAGSQTSHPPPSPHPSADHHHVHCSIEVTGRHGSPQGRLQPLGPLQMRWFNLGSTLELSILALPNAIQKISWFRRVHSLSSLVAGDVRETLKSPKVQEILEKNTSNSLIPKDFDNLDKFTPTFKLKNPNPQNFGNFRKCLKPPSSWEGRGMKTMMTTSIVHFHPNWNH